MNATEIAAALSTRAEDVCRRYLPSGRKQGRYWTAGDTSGAKGRSLFVRLAPPGIPGKWTEYVADPVMLLKDAFPMLTHGNRLSLRNIFSCTYIALRELITPRFLSTAAPIGAQRRHRSFSNRGHESVPCLAIEPHSEHRIRNMIVSPCGWRHDHGKPLGVRKLCYAGLADSHAWHGDTASLQHNWVRNIFGLMLTST